MMAFRSQLRVRVMISQTADTVLGLVVLVRSWGVEADVSSNSSLRLDEGRVPAEVHNPGEHADRPSKYLQVIANSFNPCAHDCLPTVTLLDDLPRRAGSARVTGDKTSENFSFPEHLCKDLSGEDFDPVRGFPRLADDDPSLQIGLVLLKFFFQADDDPSLQIGLVLLKSAQTLQMTGGDLACRFCLDGTGQHVVDVQVVKLVDKQS